MATLTDVRRIAEALPETTCTETTFEVMNKGKLRGFAWTWLKRTDPKKPRVPQLEVLAIRTSSVESRNMLIAAEPDKFFTEPHYDGFPAVLVNLPNIDQVELAELLIDGWFCMAPKTISQQHDRNDLLVSVLKPPYTPHDRGVP